MSEVDNKKLPKRSEVDARFKWKLEDIYENASIWEEDFLLIRQMIDEIIQYKGTIKDGGNQLLQCLRLMDDLYSKNDKLFVYARMRRDQDNQNTEYQALAERARVITTEAASATSFILPEIIALPEAEIEDYFKSVTELSLYKVFIDEILRQKKHTLSNREEEILAMSAEISGAAKDAFTMYNNADIRFPSIKDEKGEEIELTKGRYTKFLENKDQRVRHDAFMALYQTYSKHKNTVASLLASNIKKNNFYAKVRNYDSSLAASLDADNIKIKVYDKLIETVNYNLDKLHRYLALRKKALGLNELHMYDLFVPMTSEPKTNIPYEDALKMVKEGLKSLGEQYGLDLKQGYENGWIDIYENEGKTSGAYSWGAYLTHPYVLLNYQGTINDVFTLAHEMGHALHSYYTNQTQPYVYSEYKIFVAEVASTVNESLLVKHLMNQTQNPVDKAYLINYYLEGFRGTVFRQVMFAEFEKIVHQMVEKGEAITVDELCSVYKGLNEKYYGKEVVVDTEIEMEWARIPHFYNSFYVYKYATGFSAATALSKGILTEGAPAVDRYLAFLKSGGSDYPLELLKNAGVDLSTTKPVQEAMDYFDELVTELEILIEGSSEQSERPARGDLLLGSGM